MASTLVSHRPSTAPAQQPRHTKHQRKTMSRPFSARPEPVKKFEVAKSSKPLTVAQTPPMPGLARHAQATQRFEQKKRNEAKALKRRQSRGLVLRERDSNTQNLDARFEKRKAYDAELKRRQALRTVQAAQEADEAKAREEATLRRERMTPAAKPSIVVSIACWRRRSCGSTNTSAAPSAVTPHVNSVHSSAWPTAFARG